VEPAAAGDRPSILQRVLILAGVASVALAGFGVAWLLQPGANPYRADGVFSLVSTWLGPDAIPLWALVAGAVGTAVAAAGALRPARSGAVLSVLGLALMLVIGAALGSTMIVAVSGYLFGTVVAIGLLVLAGLLVVRRPAIGLGVVAGLVVVAILAIDRGVAGANAIDFLVQLTSHLWMSSGSVLVAGVVVVAAALWAGVAVLATTVAPCGRRWLGWLAKHRVLLTILAALGPVPYALARLTWLTPWPQFAPGADVLDSMPTARVTGLVIGTGAAAACVLTLGLIRRWGTTFPRWLPRVGARPVPVTLAAVPGFTVATLFIIVSGPTFLLSLPDASPAEAIVLNLALPFWFWGPMLFLAVWAYVARRTQTGCVRGAR
jgi:hypothetical protein